MPAYARTYSNQLKNIYSSHQNIVLVKNQSVITYSDYEQSTEKNVAVVEHYLRERLPSLGMSPHTPLSLPVDPSVRVAAVDVSNVKVKQSLTAPIVVSACVLCVVCLVCVVCYICVKITHVLVHV